METIIFRGMLVLGSVIDMGSNCCVVDKNVMLERKNSLDVAGPPIIFHIFLMSFEGRFWGPPQIPPKASVFG